jgi:2'-5' RNA ligase
VGLYIFERIVSRSVQGRWLMAFKTHQTAVAVVPPREVWGPIQAIRERHDRQVRRWPPHVNLLYPCHPQEQFNQAVPRLVEACDRITPFIVSRTEFRFFRHSSRKATLWLATEPKADLVRLQAALQAACPECDDLSRFAAGFTPHLSVGQVGSAEEARHLCDAWQRHWEPIRFEVSAIALLRRGQDTPFDVERWVPLATTSK